MKKKSFLNRRPKQEQMALQITSMADIFVIILVFLLKSYSVEGVAYEPSIALKPPQAKGKIENVEAMKLEVSKDALALGGMTVMPMNQFRFSTADLGEEGTSRLLKGALSKSSPQKMNSQAKSRLMVVADEGAPYETIKAVLASAASEGFLDIQLAVSHAN